MSENNMNVTNLTSAIKGISFPCSKDDLISQAKENNASQDVMDIIEGLEEDSFDSLTDVTQSFSQES